MPIYFLIRFVHDSWYELIWSKSVLIIWFSGLSLINSLIFCWVESFQNCFKYSSRLEKVTWLGEGEAHFIVLCHQDYLNGQLLTTCFSRPILSHVGDRLHSMVGGNMRYDIACLKTKWKNVKRAWKQLYWLRFTHGSGLGWDHEKEIIVGTTDQLKAIYEV